MLPKSISTRIIIPQLILVFSILSSSGSYAQAVYKYDVEKVTTDIYILKPVMNEDRWVTSNIIVIVNEKDVFVVDSGLLPAAAREAINEIKKITSNPVRYLVNTHWHGDHWQGNEAFVKAFPEIEIIATEQGLMGMSRNGMVWAGQLYIKYFQNYIIDDEKALMSGKLNDLVLKDAQIQELKTGVMQLKQDLTDIKVLNPQLPNTTFTDKMVIRKGSREIQLFYLGIGNTSGDAVVYLPKEKVLVTGDLVVYPSPYESGMFSPEWLETSRKLAAFDFQYLLPGHGDVQKNRQYLNYLNALFEEIIKQVSQAYLNGNSRIDDIKTIVTHQSVVEALNKVPSYKEFTDKLGTDFVPAAVNTSYKRIIQGKQ